MSSSEIYLGPDPWPRVLLLATMWSLAAIVFVVRRQLPADAIARRRLAATQWILTLGATVYSLVVFEVVGSVQRVFTFGLGVFAVAVCTAALVLSVQLIVGRRGSSGVA